MRLFLTGWTSLLLFSALPVHGASLLGPTPYLSFADSPFNGLSFDTWYLEDFEDGLFNVPGVTGTNNSGNGALHAFPGGCLTCDSVDGDDGAIDGLGRGGASLANFTNLPTDHLGYTFSFDSNVLGALPTHVGIVWTDGSVSAATQFEAFGPANGSLGVVGPTHIADNNFNGGTAEDRFFGAINLAGISSFTIRSPGGANNMTVDHLQYGILGSSSPSPVPEPSSLLLLGTGLLGMAGWSYRRR